MKTEQQKLPTLNNREKTDWGGGSNEQSLRDLYDSNKTCSTHVIKLSEGEERLNRDEKVFQERKAENTPNLVKDTSLQIQEAK